MRIRGCLVVTFLVGCGGGGNATDVEPTIVFADRSDAEIARLINAASGSDMFSAQSQIDQFGDTFDPDPCPTITIDGNVATVTGGCATADATGIEGVAVVTNPASWDQIEWEPGVDSLYELDAFGFDFGGFVQSYDGVIRVGSDFRSWDADLTVASFDITVRSDIHYRCTTSSCSLSDSGLELVGAGGAHVSGSVNIDGQSATASYTLRGVDTLVADVTGGCVSWHIEGTDREMVCP